MLLHVVEKVPIDAAATLNLDIAVLLRVREAPLALDVGMAAVRVRDYMTIFVPLDGAIAPV